MQGKNQLSQVTCFSVYRINISNIKMEATNSLLPKESEGQ